MDPLFVTFFGVEIFFPNVKRALASYTCVNKWFKTYEVMTSNFEPWVFCVLPFSKCVAKVRICRCIVAHAPAGSVWMWMNVEICGPINVCIHLWKWAVPSIPEVQVVILYICVYACRYDPAVCLCVWVNGRCQVLLCAAPAASGAICVEALWESSGWL